jgi:hypothetical protein
MPWYKIIIASDPEGGRRMAALLAAMEAAWLVDRAPDAALYRSSSPSEHLFFVSPALARNARETMNSFHAMQCYPPTIAHLSQVIPASKDKAPTLSNN